jgi:hypothetical protein
MASHQKTRDARAFVPYLTSTATGQYPPCTLTVCAHLLSSSPHLQRTRPASSLLRRGKEERKKKGQKGATSRTFSFHISSSQHFPVIIARFQTSNSKTPKLQAPGSGHLSLSSPLVSVHLVNLTTCHPSGIFKSACSHLVGSITTATSLTSTYLGHIGRVSRLLALGGPTFTISASSAA